MADERRFPHVRVPKSLLKIPGISAVDVAVYVVTRSYASFAKQNDKFARARPSVRRICSTFEKRLGRATVFRSLARLEAAGFIIRKDGGYNRPSIILFVDNPEAFLQAVQKHGQEAARGEVEGRLDSVVEEARAGSAEEARKARAVSPRDLSLQGRDLSTGQATDPGGSSVVRQHQFRGETAPSQEGTSINKVVDQQEEIYSSGTHPAPEIPLAQENRPMNHEEHRPSTRTRKGERGIRECIAEIKARALADPAPPHLEDPRPPTQEESEAKESYREGVAVLRAIVRQGAED